MKRKELKKRLKRRRRIVGLSLLLSVLMFRPGMLRAEEEIAIDESNFPDANFRAFITENIDSDQNGKLSQAERDAVIELDLMSKSLSDVSGLKYFGKLKKLDCTANRLKELDLSGNPELEEVYAHNNSLPAVDLSHNKKLKKAGFAENWLTEVNLGELPLFEELAVDLQYSSPDYFPVIAKLDLSGVPALKVLKLEETKEPLDLSAQTALESLYCSGGKHFTSIDLTPCTALKDLKLSCLYQQELLDLSANVNLKTISVTHSEIKAIKLPPQAEVEELKLHVNQLTSVDLDVLGSIGSYSIYENKYDITLDPENYSFDSAELPGNFDPARVRDVTGADFADGIFKVAPTAAEGEIEYVYALNNTPAPETATFKLHYEFDPSGTEPTEPTEETKPLPPLDDTIRFEDEESGISVSAPKEILPPELELVVDPLPLKYEGYISETYDIYFLKEKQYYEINGKVKVRIPYGAPLKKELIQVFYNPGDELIEIPARVEKDYVEFTTNHFSKYVIANKTTGTSEKVELPDASATDAPGVVKTGANGQIYLTAGIISLAAAAALFILAERFRRED